MRHTCHSYRVKVLVDLSIGHATGTTSALPRSADPSFTSWRRWLGGVRDPLAVGYGAVLRRPLGSRRLAALLAACGALVRVVLVLPVLLAVGKERFAVVDGLGETVREFVQEPERPSAQPQQSFGQRSVILAQVGCQPPLIQRHDLLNSVAGYAEADMTELAQPTNDKIQGLPIDRALALLVLRHCDESREWNSHNFLNSAQHRGVGQARRTLPECLHRSLPGHYRTLHCPIRLPCLALDLSKMFPAMPLPTVQDEPGCSRSLHVSHQ